MPKYEELKNKLKQIIKNSNPHDLLPSQRTLAKDYNVSSITVQRTLSDLENEGFIYVKHGKGNFVAPKIAYFPEVHFICDSLRTTGYGDEDLFPTIIEDIDLCLRENNMETIISFYKSTYRLEIQLIESLPQKKPYGAILFYSGRQQPVDAYRKLCDCMQNVVFVDRKVEGINAHYVATDNFNTTYKMAQILTQEKFDKIYYFSMPDIHTNVDHDRYAGFEAFMKEKNLDYDRYFIEKEVMGEEAVNKLLLKFGRNLKKQKRVLLFHTNPYDLYFSYIKFKDIIDSLDYVRVATFEKPISNINSNIKIMWVKQNLKEIAKECVKIIKENPKEKRTVLVPGEIIEMDEYVSIKPDLAIMALEKWNIYKKFKN